MTAATTIDQVLEQLTAILDDCKASQSRLGYFAAMYRRVTARVKQRIEEGWFDDNARMERLDVLFANRYIDAFAGWRARRPVTGVWRAAFEAAERGDAVILQHLASGMNAHINLDLAIAAAETAPGAALPAMQRDFQRINEILFSMIDEMEARVATVSPWMGVLSFVGGKSSDEIVRFSLEGARALAWKHAQGLAALPQDQWGERIAAMDTVVEGLGRLVFKPGPILRTGLWIVRRREQSDARKVIAALE